MQLPTDLARQMASYEEYHAHPANRILHAIGLPFIVLAVAGALAKAVLPGGLPLAFPALVAICLWYATLDRVLALLMAGAYSACAIAGGLLPWWALAACFVGGWACLLSGHAIWEKKSPAFLTNLLQLLVGPLHLAARATGRWPPHR
ncbi:MAG TPA: Mpo1-like protein [Patescibacteria group bacterium]|nr:Mpo1-like protein [Patescibacteria group bacterium]